jgi:3-phosphoshikimate 1-carboxyvinyltransferase
MERVAAPLRSMGAGIETEGGRPPLRIAGRPLHGIEYDMPVASAQVKSAVLLAGLFATGRTMVRELSPSRDHTERMLRARGVAVDAGPGWAAVAGGQRPEPLDLRLPGDLSSAAFLFAGAALGEGPVSVAAVGVNPTRAAFLEVLKRSGVTVTLQNTRDEGGEPVADVTVSGRVQRAVEIEPEEVPALIDELPLVALIGTQAVGTSVVRGAAELRYKESDRIAATVEGIRALGGRATEYEDGFSVEGPVKLRGTVLGCRHDHRIAMMLGIAGTVARGETIVDGVEAAAISFPGFDAVLRHLGGDIRAD